MTHSGAVGFFVTCAVFSFIAATYPELERRWRQAWCGVGAVFLAPLFIAALRALLA